MADPVNIDSVKMAVKVAVAAAPMQGASVIFHPDDVAKFVETVARKIDELRFPKD